MKKITNFFKRTTRGVAQIISDLFYQAIKWLEDITANTFTDKKVFTFIVFLIFAFIISIVPVIGPMFLGVIAIRIASVHLNIIGLKRKKD